LPTQTSFWMKRFEYDYKSKEVGVKLGEITSLVTGLLSISLDPSGVTSVAKILSSLKIKYSKHTETINYQKEYIHKVKLYKLKINIDFQSEEIEKFFQFLVTKNSNFNMNFHITVEKLAVSWWKMYFTDCEHHDKEHQTRLRYDRDTRTYTLTWKKNGEMKSKDHCIELELGSDRCNCGGFVVFDDFSFRSRHCGQFKE
jgi:hypothetical protein